MDFSFPFVPYEVQRILMKEIKQCIEEEQIGIFESPTGTGKSMSVLCATMTWLEEYEKKTEEDLTRKLTIANEADGDDWISAHKKKVELERLETENYEKLKVLEKVKQKVLDARNRVKRTSRKRNLWGGDRIEEQMDATDCDVPGNYGSDDEFDSNVKDTLEVVKIFYASRTHSQLDQLIDELKKTRFLPRVVTAVSRQTLCANDSVRRLKYNHLINEKCMELRKACSSGGKRMKLNEKDLSDRQSTSKCPYYKCDAIEELSDEILAGKLLRPHEIVECGKQFLACPYFSSRLSLPLCQLVLLPYQVLLHASTRAAWGIHLKGNVLVLDEAHNILGTIESLYSSEVTSVTITLAVSLIREYIETYRSQLKSKNLMYIRQLLTIVVAMEQFLKKDSLNSEEVLTIQGIIISLGLIDINIFKIVHYMDATDMCRKFHGFFVRAMNRNVSLSSSIATQRGISKLLAGKNTDNKNPLPVASNEIRDYPSPLFTIKQFLEALSNRCEDGRIIVVRKENTRKFRFILLNPAMRLTEVVNEARATIFIGGTMEPADLLIDCLSRGGIKNGIRRFSCSHVIDDDQLLALSIGRNACNEKFTLTYETKSDDGLMKSIAETVMLMVCEVPNGCVVFFTSYEIMSRFLTILENSKVVQQVNMRKKIFVETRGPSDDIWDKFSIASRTNNGAILFAVAGGKLSEGINFSDELARAVFMIGLPYPNKNSVELKEKMAYLDSQMRCGGSKYYQSLCMHVVNQAIGRAIRHRRDYAAVYLLDHRFTRQDIISALPGWISKRIRCPSSFAEVLTLTKAFFKNKI